MGGLTIAIKKSVKSKLKLIYNSEHIMALRLISIHITVLVAYFPPGTAIEDIFFNISDALHYSETRDRVIIAGDFNARLDQGTRGEELLELLYHSGYTSLNCPNTPTYICHNGSSTIDLVFVNDPKLVPSKLLVSDNHATKHSVISLKLNASYETNANKSTAIRECNVEMLKGHIDLSLQNGIDVFYNNFVSAIRDSSITKKKRTSKLWFDKECYILHDKLKQQYKNTHGSMTKTNLAALATVKKQFKTLCKRKKTAWQKRRQEKILYTAETDKSQFWNILKVKKQQPAQCHVTADEWSDHFTSLFDVPTVPFNLESAEISGNHDYVYSTVETANDLTKDITLNEITEAIAKSPNHKAAGPDGITNEVLKHTFGVIYPFLLILFNFCLREATCPTIWRNSYLIPLYKGKGQKNDPGNYRGISLLSCTFKTYTSILYNRLLSWVENHELLPETQFGFRKGRSTIQATKHLIDAIKAGVNSAEKCYYVGYVDFEKAFDKINRQLLFKKLQARGLHSHFLTILHNIYTENNIQVSLDDYLSEIISQKVGVPQGDKLSPLLFALFIADLSEILQKTGCFIIFYADDLAIGTTNLSNLQDAFIQLEKYCSDNGMSVNIKKTKIVKYRKGGRLASTDVIFYKNVPLEFVDKFEYLGIWLSTRLSPKHHLEHRRKKAISVIGRLQAQTMFRNMNFTSASRLYSSIAIPAGFYGLEVFVDCLTQQNIDDHLKKISGFFFKKWLGISNHSNTTKTLTNLLYNDFLNVQTCHPYRRRQLALFYVNGYHQELCQEENCYQIVVHDLSMTHGFALCESCKCKFCNMEIVDDLHLNSCSYFDLMPTLDLKIRLLNEFIV